MTSYFDITRRSVLIGAGAVVPLPPLFVRFARKAKHYVSASRNTAR